MKHRTMKYRTMQLVTVLVAVTAGVHAASAQMTFNITNGGGATAQMMTGMAEAAALWSARFNDPITINIQLKASALPNGVIGHTDTFYDPYSYTSVRAALQSNRKTADDISSSNALQAAPAFSMLINHTANNPAGVVSATPYFDTGLGGAGQAGPENNSTVRMSSANAKALSLIPGNNSGTDGIITFTTTNFFDFNRADGITSNKIDFVGVAAHEIGHMMGFTSGVDVLAGNSAAPGQNDNQLKYVTTLDLFRFSTRSIGAGGGVGVNDWTDDDFSKYLSVNGGLTPVAEFSTGSVYEASHWKNGLGLGIMNPTTSGGILGVISENDVRAFDVIGYDRIVPEPSSSAMIFTCLCLALGRRRRRLFTPADGVLRHIHATGSR